MNSFKIISFSLVVCALSFSNCKKEADMNLDNTVAGSAEGTNSGDANAVSDRSITYTMPSESEAHEGTWLQFPHHYQYGAAYRNDLIGTWVAMTKELVSSEKVHIIAYNTTHKNWIITKLNAAGVPLANVDFKIMQTNDVWVRDNGPIFVKTANGTQKIEDWGFNGWGGKAPYGKCNPIPSKVGTAIGMSVVNLNTAMKVEGGAFEVDGNGTATPA
jgi:agmatine deiminase